MLEEVNLKFVPGGNSGRFEWVDSILVTALRQGYWLLISHANFCRSDHAVNVILTLSTRL